MSTAPASTPADPVRICPPGLPRHTLAWQAFGWTTRYLQQPDGPDAGGVLSFTNEQARFLAWWYAIDETGRFLFRNGMFRRMKGHGKDPLGAAICAIEFVGPCRFSRWGDDGEPIAVAHPSAWVQLAAVAKEQTRTTLTLFPTMFSDRAKAEYEIDLGKEIIYALGGSRRIEAVTSSPLALEGPRATFVLKNETHHWISSNEGHEMSKVIARNAAKGRDGAARVLAISNAHEPGEDSDAERDWDAFQAIAAGTTRAGGFLYDSLEAPPGTELDDAESLRAGLLAARGDSDWLDVDRLMGEIWDPRTDPSDARRYYLNQIVAAEDAWIAPHQWDLCAAAKVVLAGADEITLGFDGSKTDDHTALVGCRVSDGHLFTIGLWDPAAYPPAKEIPTADVDAAVIKAMSSHTVVGFFSDVAEWESYVDKWEAAWGELMYAKSAAKRAIAWDMRGRPKELTAAVEATHNAIVERALTHEGSRRASQYVYNARRRPNQYGVTFGKESRESPRKVDWLAAAVLARMARQAYLLLPPNKRRRTKTGKATFA